MAEHEHSEKPHSAGGHGHGGGGGGAHEEHEGAPEWLISFADNVALMMGFFVILLAMNMQKPSMGGIGGEGKNLEDTPEMQDFVIAVRQAFNSPVNPESDDPNEAGLRERIRQKERQGKSTDSGPQGDKDEVQAPVTSDFVAPVGVVPFELRSTTINPAGRLSISQFAQMLRGRRHVIEVRGHVSAAEAFRDPNRAMDLAYRRALAVAASLVEDGMGWDRLRVTACADSMPIVARADAPADHASNQRVEIVATQETISSDQFTDGADAGR